MNCKEMMLGDYVSLDGKPKRFLDCLRNVNLVRPLRLKEEMLEKNGWRKSSEKHYSKVPFISEFYSGKERWYPSGEKSFILVPKNRIFYLLVMDRLVPIAYVHELQHALLLYGLNELAENFKV